MLKQSNYNASLPRLRITYAAPSLLNTRKASCIVYPATVPIIDCKQTRRAGTLLPARILNRLYLQYCIISSCRLPPLIIIPHHRIPVQANRNSLRLASQTKNVSSPRLSTLLLLLHLRVRRRLARNQLLVCLALLSYCFVSSNTIISQIQRNGT